MYSLEIILTFESSQHGVTYVQVLFMIHIVSNQGVERPCQYSPPIILYI